MLGSRIRPGPTAQVVIVGAGPAGMMLARELASVAQVLVIESGGFEDDPDQQALLVGEVRWDGFIPSRRPERASSAAHLPFGLDTAPYLTPHDFSLRNWVPGSGWPFGVESLEPYYAKTAELLQSRGLEFRCSRYRKARRR